MKILYKFPTRGRPQIFKSVLDAYYSLMSGRYDFKFQINLDIDDALMTDRGITVYLDSKKNLEYHFGNSKNKIDAVNRDMDRTTYPWDILVLVSDDMIPIVQNYDDIIVDLMTEYFPNTFGALHFNDGLYGKDKTITLSIMGRKMYEYFGYIYHPAYKSFWCDNEFTDEVYTLDKVIYLDQVIIKHNWRGNGADDLYVRNSKMGKGDDIIYSHRKEQGFPKNLDWRLDNV